MSNAFQKAIKDTAKPATPAKAKSTNKAYIKVTDEVKEAVDKFVAANKAEKAAKAEKAFNETTIIDHVRKVQDNDGFANKHQKSYDVPGNTESLKYVSKNQASINSEDADVIKTMLDSDYDFLMDEQVTVTLKSEVFDIDAKQEELMSLLGEKFAEFFDVETKLKIADDYDKNIYSVVKGKNKAAKQSNLDKVRTYVKMYKPALRG